MTLKEFKLEKQEHDFKNFPELTNGQMDRFYFQSPHKQITEDFVATVVKVIDGDTVRLETDFRDFTFPLRIAELAAPELDETGGIESQKWLSEKILGEEVEIKLTKERVEKWGRLLGKILLFGMDIGEESRMNGKAVEWEARKGLIQDHDKELDKWA